MSKKDYQKTEQKRHQIHQGLQYLRTGSQLVRGPGPNSFGDRVPTRSEKCPQVVRRTAPKPIGELPPKGRVNLYQLLKRPQVSIKDLKLPFKASAEVLHGIEVEVKYSGFIRRQLAEVRNFKHLEKIKIAPDLDYDRVNGLSREIKEKLNKFRPFTLGQANRISGLTPVAIMILLVYLRKQAKK